MLNQTINFIDLKSKFDSLSKGDKAELRRATKLADVFKIRVSYRLLPKDEKPSRQWERVLFFLPFGEHLVGGNRVGELLAYLQIKEQKVQQMLKSTSPNDLLLLRDLSRWADQKNLLKLDYQYFCESLYFWGSGYKQAIEKDYFLTCRKIAQELAGVVNVEVVTNLAITLKDEEKLFSGLPISSMLSANLQAQDDVVETIKNLESKQVDGTLPVVDVSSKQEKMSKSKIRKKKETKE